MDNWVKHQTGSKPVPRLVHGYGDANEDPPKPDANFSLDKSGLFLPDGAARERRKVKIGFQPPADEQP